MTIALATKITVPQEQVLAPVPAYCPLSPKYSDLSTMEISERSATAVLDGAPYTTVIKSRGLEAMADEPDDHGGADKGMRPHELLLGALASCTAITVRMYADRKQWNTGAITVTASLERSQEGRTVESRIHLELEIANTLPPDQRDRLLQIAGMCPVHRTLQSPIHISKSLKV